MLYLWVIAKEMSLSIFMYSHENVFLWKILNRIEATIMFFWQIQCENVTLVFNLKSF